VLILYRRKKKMQALNEELLFLFTIRRLYAKKDGAPHFKKIKKTMAGK
jgi:hypothetical protein